MEKEKTQIGNSYQEIVNYQTNTTIRIWNNNTSNYYPVHWHSALEIVIPMENYYIIDVNDQHFNLMPGEILFIPSGELHALTAPNTGSRFIFMFDISILSNIKSFSSIQSLLVQPIHLTHNTHPAIYDDIYSLLMNMQVEFFQGREYSELTIYSLLIELFVKLGYDYLYGQELFPDVRLPKQKEYIRKFQQLLAYIDEHYMEELDLDKLSDSIEFSKFHFLRLFKQYMGATVGDYVTLRRIKAAEQLLCNQNRPISEVAALSGFSSISTFNRLFKQYKNCSPSEYRQHHNIH